jgi:GNAT superfamily N-acetyltransferase
MDWRTMTADDLHGVVEVAAIAFPNHFEDRACFENRLALWPQGCWVLGDDAGVAGYLFAYPWFRDGAPALNTVIPGIPTQADILYLHDLALHPRSRGRGASRTGMDRVLELARTGGWDTVALIAVNDAAAFWQGHGFVGYEVPGLAEKLVGYGPDARYMIRAV